MRTETEADMFNEYMITYLRYDTHVQGRMVVHADDIKTALEDALLVLESAEIQSIAREG